MLRNKLGKPTSNTNNQPVNKNDASIKSSTNPLGNKNLGFKVPSNTGFEIPQTPLNTINKPSFVPGNIGANLNFNKVQQSNPLSKQPKLTSQVNTQPAKQIASFHTKTQQQRLAQLVSKKAAQMKRQSQMINKISSQVGGQKRNFFKQYSGQYSYALTIMKPKNQNKKQNYDNQNPVLKDSLYQWISNSQSKINQYCKENFKKQKYM